MIVGSVYRQVHGSSEYWAVITDVDVCDPSAGEVTVVGAIILAPSNRVAPVARRVTYAADYFESQWEAVEVDGPEERTCACGETVDGNGEHRGGYGAFCG